MCTCEDDSVGEHKCALFTIQLLTVRSAATVASVQAPRTKETQTQIHAPGCWKGRHVSEHNAGICKFWKYTYIRAHSALVESLLTHVRMAPSIQNDVAMGTPNPVYQATVASSAKP